MLHNKSGRRLITTCSKYRYVDMVDYDRLGPSVFILILYDVFIHWYRWFPLHWQRCWWHLRISRRVMAYFCLSNYFLSSFSSFSSVAYPYFYQYQLILSALIININTAHQSKKYSDLSYWFYLLGVLFRCVVIDISR